MYTLVVRNSNFKVYSKGKLVLRGSTYPLNASSLALVAKGKGSFKALGTIPANTTPANYLSYLSLKLGGSFTNVYAIIGKVRYSR